MAGMMAARRGEYSLLDYGALLTKRWRWVALPVLALGALALVLALRQPDNFRAAATVLVADTASQQALDARAPNAGILNRELSNEILLAESSPVEELVEAELGTVPKVEIDAVSGADALRFVANAAEPEQAALFANTWAGKYIQAKQDEAVANITAAKTSLTTRLDDLRVRRQELRSSLDGLQRRVGEDEATAPSALQAQLDEARYELDLVEAQAQATTSSLTDLELQAELAAVGEARMVQVAGPPRAPSNTPVPLLVAIGCFLGLLVGVGAAVLIEAFDRTIKTAADVAEVTDLPVLASIPKAARRSGDPAFAIVEDSEGLVANAYHKVRSSLEFVGLEQEIRSILVTSANASEGKSTTSSNLALAFASVGNQTVLMDVDFRRPRQHELYRIDQAPGLSDYILYGAALARVAHPLHEPGIAEMRIIPSGTVPPSPAALIGAKSFQETVDWIVSHAEIVTLDAPPLLAVPDALTLGQHVDAIVVTARAGQTTKDELREVVGMLRQTQATVAGVVLIGVAEADSYGKGYQAKTAVVRRGTPADTANGAGGLWADDGQSVAGQATSVGGSR